jgi:hypothetical protein
VSEIVPKIKVVFITVESRKRVRIKCEKYNGYLVSELVTKLEEVLTE